MIQRTMRWLKIRFVKGVFFTGAVIVTSAWSGTPADNYLFAGGVVSWHERSAYIDFGNGRIEYIQRNRLRTQGLSLGRNFGLPFGLRLGLPVMFEYGSVREGVEDLLVNDDGVLTEQPVELNSVMYHAGVQPLLHFPRHITAGLWVYGAIGGGFHYVALIEEEREVNNRKVRVNDDYLETSKKVSFSVNAGAGCEISATPEIVIALQYLFGFWKPVSRGTSRDLFILETQPYAERFFTHAVTLAFCITRNR